MSRDAFEALRLPIAIVLLVIAAAFVLWPRDPDEPAVAASPSPSVVVGPVGGAVVAPSAAPAASLPPSPSSFAPTDTPGSTPTATPAPTPAAAADGFSAEVLACRSISGATCNDQLGTLPAGAGTFTALVRFTSAAAGDQMNAVLSGPSGPIAGFPYTLQGSGDGYYYSQFQAGGLPAGTYTLTATRNGAEVAVTTFEKAG